MRFKLLRGTHGQRELESIDIPCDKCNGTGRVDVPGKKGEWPCTKCLGTGHKHSTKTYSAKDPSNSIVTSDVDLEMRFGSEKFQNLDRVTDDDVLKARIRELEEENVQLKSVKTETDTNEEQGLQSMTVRELRAMARDMDVDLSSTNGKEEIVNMLQSVIDAA